LFIGGIMESNEPRNLSNRKDRAAGTDLFLKLGQCASVEGVLEDLTRIAADKGIYLCGIRIKSDRLEREFYLPNNGGMAGKISEFTVAVKGGHTQLVVLFCESEDSSALSELMFFEKII
jgi:hypothetical protein